VDKAISGGGGPAVTARQIIDANYYLTLATADSAGTPWASPVWYAHEGHGTFFWVSRPQARHSRNLTTRATGLPFAATPAAKVAVCRADSCGYFR
jgi:hypothetical protein